MKDDALMELASAVVKEIEAQPKDGKEHSFTVTVGANNSGNVLIGSTQVLINPARKERGLDECSVTELREQLGYWERQWWSGWRGFWLNPPCVLLLALLLSMVTALISGWFFSLSPQQMPYILAPLTIAIPVLMLWMVRVRRIEGQLMADSRAASDAIKMELRRRRK